MTTRHLTITDIASTGAGIAYEDGLRVFVPGALPGDEVTAEVDPPARGTRSSVAQYVKSPWWAASPCPAHVARPACGGCALGSLTPEGQAVVKRGLLERALAESGVEAPEPLPLVEAPHDAEAFTQGFRNKAVLYPGVDPEGRWYFAMYAQGSHFPVPESCFCPQTPEWMAKAAETAARMLSLSDLSPWNESHREGDVRTIVMRDGVDSEKPQRLFTLCVHGETPEVRIFVGKLAKKLMEEGITSVFLNLHPTPGNAVLGRHSLHVAGTDGIETTIGGLRFAVRPETFLQVNPGQTERLYAMALEWVAPEKDEVLLDLYCGMGTIGLSMADRCRELIGVEIVPEAIDSAKANAARMGDAVAAKSRFFCADAGQAAARLAAEGLRPDVIMLDPPRKGCDETTLSAVVQMSPRRVVYVSCNPSTAARDAAWLEEHGYHAEKVQPVDLFPRTRHCECVIALSKGEIDS